MSLDLKDSLIIGALVTLIVMGHYVLKRLDRIIQLLERRRE